VGTFYGWMQSQLNIDLPAVWKDSELVEVDIYRESQRLQMTLALPFAATVKELRMVEDKIAATLGISEINIKPVWADIDEILSKLIVGRQDELKKTLSNNEVFDDQLVSWEIEQGKIELRAVDQEVWENLLAAEVCSRLAEWISDQYRVNILVKTTCGHKVNSSCQEPGQQMVKVKAGTFIAAGEKKGSNRKANKNEKPAPLVECLHELDEGMGRVAINAQIFAVEIKTLKGNRNLAIYSVTDYTDSLLIKHFLTDNQDRKYNAGDWVQIAGYLQYDNFEHEMVMIADNIKPTEPKKREDKSPVKRVELHAHTVMSSLDGLVPVAQLVKTAADWGHQAVAITDHGVVQAFPDAYQAGQRAGIKVILGMEGYLVNGDKQSRAYHIIILARNYTGLRNLYQLVSRSYLDNFYRTPRIKREEILELREGLLLGTACEAGELFQAVLQGADDTELDKIAAFYDYIEIQPIGNNSFMLRENIVSSKEELQDINRRLVALGNRLELPVVATGDVHFLEPRDEVFRRILQAGKGMNDAELQAPLYLHTTEEMLEEFSYLGEEEAQQVVICHPQAIAEQIENIKPVPDELYTPTIEGADEIISNLSKQRAEELYGTPLHPLVTARLDKELTSIVGHGFSNLYYIAYRLVKKSNEDGYLVGSRGSVGSSLVAYLTGITEVNPLPPHYVCPACQHSEFITDGSIGCGADMEIANCPSCGHEYRRDGFDIPFETFLGFDGDKVPDIDLNFSGDYQAIAHQFVEELFGRDKVFRAGTISTIAEKTAYGYVKKYMEAKEIKYRTPEINRLLNGITGVKRTTGQHPGGLMIVPREKDVHEFTPLQHPADDPKSGIITTHFDYHSISERLVKVDILGHDDPTMIKTLTDLTGYDARLIPLDEPQVMSLFSSTGALGVTPKQIRSEIGTYGVPEFGTRFVRQMLEATRPQTFSELTRISGLSHGTDVWLNNAQALIAEQTATLNEVICTRDDIMTYLIYNQVPAKTAFKIMENVRKGKGLTPEYIDVMQENKISDWYIASCQKIKYMFPKAHAVAYVMMAYRIAYYKVYYPEQFYAAYFTVRAEDFDAEAALAGSERVVERLEEIEKMGLKASPKEKNLLPILELTLEALARKIKFLPVNLWQSESSNFIVTSTGIMLPFNALPGVGKQAARAIALARSQAPFTSIHDLQSRAHISTPVVEILKNAGCLTELPESSQIALFA